MLKCRPVDINAGDVSWVNRPRLYWTRWRIDQADACSLTSMEDRDRLRFDVQRYEPSSGFYPLIDINFQIGETPRHYHVPLLLSQYGYSTYLGS